MFEGLMKQNVEHAKILAKMIENNAKLHSLLSKKVLDAQKNKVQCPQHSQAMSTSPPSQPKAPDQLLHRVENPIA
jgi:hypothetical protein